MDLRKSGSNMGGIGGEGTREGYKYSTIKWKSQKINKSLKSLLRTGFLTPPTSLIEKWPTWNPGYLGLFCSIYFYCNGKA